MMDSTKNAEVLFEAAKHSNKLQAVVRQGQVYSRNYRNKFCSKVIPALFTCGIGRSKEHATFVM